MTDVAYPLTLELPVGGKDRPVADVDLETALRRRHPHRTGTAMYRRIVFRVELFLYCVCFCFCFFVFRIVVLGF